MRVSTISSVCECFIGSCAQVFWIKFDGSAEMNVRAHFICVFASLIAVSVLGQSRCSYTDNENCIHQCREENKGATCYVPNRDLLDLLTKTNNKPICQCQLGIFR